MQELPLWTDIIKTDMWGSLPDEDKDALYRGYTLELSKTPEWDELPGVDKTALVHGIRRTGGLTRPPDEEQSIIGKTFEFLGEAGSDAIDYWTTPRETEPIENVSAIGDKMFSPDAPPPSFQEPRPRREIPSAMDAGMWHEEPVPKDDEPLVPMRRDSGIPIFLRDAVDSVKAAYRGLGAGSAMVGETVGAGAEWLGQRLPESVGEPISEVGKKVADYYEKERKAYAPPKRIEGSVYKKPNLLLNGEWWTYNVANFAPSLIAAFIPGVGIAKVIQVGGKAIKLTPAVVERIARIGLVTGAGTAGGSMEGLGTYRELLKQGKSENEASNAGMLMGLFAAGLNTFGFSKILSKTVGGPVKQAIKHGVAGVTEGTTEALEEPLEEFSKDVATYLETGSMPEGTLERMVAATKERGLNVFGPAMLIGGGTSVVAGKEVAPIQEDTSAIDISEQLKKGKIDISEQLEKDKTDIVSESIPAPNGKPFKEEAHAKLYGQVKNLKDHVPAQVKGGWVLVSQKAVEPPTIVEPEKPTRGMPLGEEVAPGGVEGVRRGEDSSGLMQVTTEKPESLIFREEEQNNLDFVRDKFPGAEGIAPITAVKTLDGLEIINGHNRTLVAKENDKDVEVVGIEEELYTQLKDAGFDDMEISYGMLVDAGYDDFASGIDNQFPGSEVGKRGMKVLNIIDDFSSRPSTPPIGKEVTPEKPVFPKNTPVSEEEMKADIAQRNNVPVESLEFANVWEMPEIGETLYQFHVTDKDHPSYRSTLAYVPEKKLERELAPSDVGKEAKEPWEMTTDEREEWFDKKAEEYGSRNKFFASDEYKKIYPKLYEKQRQEGKEYKAKVDKALKEAGLEVTDNVTHVSPDGQTVAHGSLYRDNKGMPKVKIHTEEGPQGKVTVNKIKVWHKGWEKSPEKAKPVEGEKVSEEQRIRDRLKILKQEQKDIMESVEGNLNNAAYNDVLGGLAPTKVRHNANKSEIARLREDLRKLKGEAKITVTPIQEGNSITRPKGQGLLLDVYSSKDGLLGKIGRDNLGGLYVVKEGNVVGDGFKTVAKARKYLEDYTPKPKPPTKPTGEELPSGYADTGGYATNIKSVIELPEIVYFAKELMKGKHPKIKEKLRKRNAVGVFYPKGEGRIEMMANLFSDPDQAAAVLSHEIGHLIDYLPDKDLKRGNILGRIASLKKHLKHTLPKVPSAPGELTEKDRRRLRYLAKKYTEAENKDKWIDEEIEEVLPISPQDVLNIWNAVEDAKFNPELLDYAKRLNTPEKKSIVKEALKGQVADQLSQFAKRIKTKTGKKIKIEVTKDMILQRYKKLINEELKKRELFTGDEISNELKALTRTWKPFDPSANPKYTQYRYSSPELYADAISALINAPGLLKSTAPRFYEAFFNYMENKPEVQRIYNQIQDDISSGQHYPDARKRVRAGFDKKEEQWMKELTTKNKIGGSDAWGTALVDKAWSIVRRVKKLEDNIPESMNPMHRIDDMLYTAIEVEGYLTEANQRFIRPLEKAGITRKDFGEYLFYRRVANEDVPKAASQGITPKRAKIYITDIEAKYGSIIKEMAEDFHAFRKEHILDKLAEVKMHSPELLKLMADADTYATFDVVQDSEKRHGNALTSHIYKRIGHLGDIGDPFTATIMKDSVLIKAANQNVAAKTFINFMETYFPNEINDADMLWNDKYKSKVLQKPNDAQLGFVGYLKDGKPIGKYVSKYLAASFENNPVETMLLSNILRYTAQPFKEVFTGKNPGFWAFNILRDYQRAIKNIKGANIRKFTPQYIKGIKPAFQSIFGVPDEVIKKFQKDKMLISAVNYRGDVPEEVMWERMLKRYSITPTIWKNKILKPFSQFFYYVDGIGRALERVSKFGGYFYLKKHFPDMTDDMVKFAIRHRIGSPSFLTRGTAAPITNNLLFYSNAMEQGWRADYNVFKDQKGDYAFKTAKYAILPKLIQYTIEIGLLGGLIGYFTGDDDDNDLKTIMDKTSDYDKANYTNIPLGLTPQGKAVTLRIPQDETSRLIGGITWKLLNKDKPAMLTNLFDYMAGQAPTLHPGLTLLWAVKDYASGKNPYDAFRGRGALDPTVYKAGGPRSHKEFAKWIWDQMGGGIVYRFGSDKPNQIKTELEEVLGIPVLSNVIGRFIKVSDYGERKDFRDKLTPIYKKQAEKTLLRRDAVQKMLKDELLTDEEKIATIEGYKTIGKAYQRAIVNKYGNVFVQELLAAKNNEERIALWEVFFEKYPEAQKEYPEQYKTIKAVNQ